MRRRRPCRAEILRVNNLNGGAQAGRRFRECLADCVSQHLGWAFAAEIHDQLA